jgi:hypothetical protein
MKKAAPMSCIGSMRRQRKRLHCRAAVRLRNSGGLTVRVFQPIEPAGQVFGLLLDMRDG